ncbi:MAG TPA: hypothetical protein VMH27_01850 [Puia sp.]|nr:hypothetical protein [Puia sp.]
MRIVQQLLILTIRVATAISVTAINASAQDLFPAVQRLKNYCLATAPYGYSPHLRVLSLTPKDNIHYLFPLYHGFRDEQKFRQIYSDKGYYDEMSQYFAFAGDYETALQFLVKSYDTVDDATAHKIYKTASNLKDIQHVNAARYIHLEARSRRVIMINEAFAKPVHRAFTLSLLADLYRQGFRYLAMEMLNNFSNRSLSRVTMNTGYYAAEPVAAELIRSARQLGYTLVPYEDTAAAIHTATQRDSVQAANIYDILKKDTGAKILVHASFAHISKKPGPGGFIPMALAFRNMSGIDPLTIDQTDMTEESNFAYGRIIYQAYLAKFPLTEPSIALINGNPVNVTDKDLYDLCVIHPPSVYKDSRPTWLSLGGLRKPFIVKPPVEGVFLTQAYYLNEIVGNNNGPWQLIPADQTYITTGSGNYPLYLRKGKYRIFFRDINYQILSTLNVEVN